MPLITIRNATFLEAGLKHLDDDLLIAWRRPCRPRILVVTDASLNFRHNSAFGLWRFLHAITLAPGVTTKPILTLAYRGAGHPTPIAIDADVYPVVSGFDFKGAQPAVNTSNYDQIWMFGFAGSGSLRNAEIDVISEFMNSGGGVFATGDHATIGRQMCGNLPRIRRMREWTGIPMGTEDDLTVAVERIDTVVNPGPGNLYEFEDQSDDIPQRIYPGYKVSPDGPTQWRATVHPLLMLPGAPLVRTEAAGAAGFTLDIDVLPDHPHESVCYAVTSPATLNDTYNVGSQDFEEWQPSAAVPAKRFGAEIVAYAVSGGRSVLNGVWKPPVRPQMFGAISAYDGRLAQPYPGKSQRPGRIVCDSTWHHFVNINLDGVGTTRNALGSWSGGSPLAGTFSASAALEKIFTYYRNTVSWLQPANRVWCHLWWDLVAVRFNGMLIEEMLDAAQPKRWRDFAGLGRQAAQLLALAYGSEAVRELIDGVFLSDRRTEALVNALQGATVRQSDVDDDELRQGALGAMLAKMATLLPIDDDKAVAEVLEAGPQRYAKELLNEAVRAIGLAMEDRAERARRTMSAIKELRTVVDDHGAEKA